MGLSTNKTKTQETATTTPTNPAFASVPTTQYYNQVGQIGQRDPYSFATEANPLQVQAGAAAGNLGPGWRSGAQDALQMTREAVSSGPNTAQTATYNPYTSQANQAQTTLFGGVQMSPAQQAAAQQAQAYGYNVPTAANVATAQGGSFGGASLGPAAQATAQGYTAQQAEAARIADIERMTGAQAQSASLLDGGLDRYLNPATEAVVDTTLANYDDNSGRVRAAQAAQAAQAGAFGGSRLGVREAYTEEGLARTRASTEAGLRSDAFDRATGLAVSDADRRQGANLFNANSTNAANSQNANAFNTRGIAQGQLDQSRNLFNTGAVNDASAFGANADNTNSMFNTGQTNQQSQVGAQLANQAGIANMNNQSQLAMFNAGAQNQNSQFNTSLQAQAARDLAAAQNSNSQFNAGLTTNNNQFNAGQSNQQAQYQAGLTQQAGLSNQDALNSGAQFNTGQANSLLGQNLAAQNQAAQFNAGATNQGSMFNAQQQDQYNQMRLAQAGQLGQLANNYGQNARADIDSQLAAGNALWGVQNQYNQAPLTALQAQSQLLNPSLQGLYTGQTINSSGTQTGSNGLFGQILGAAAQVGSAAAFASERRVKRDIELISRDADGMGRYGFSYIWDKPGDPKRYGTMVDEVETLRPWALGPVIDGIRTVDYSNLEAR